MNLYPSLFPGELNPWRWRGGNRREEKQRDAKERGGGSPRRGVFPLDCHWQRLPKASIQKGPFPTASRKSQCGQKIRPQPEAKGQLCVMAGSPCEFAVITGSVFCSPSPIRKGWYWGVNSNSTYSPLRSKTCFISMLSKHCLTYLVLL